MNTHIWQSVVKTWAGVGGGNSDCADLVEQCCSDVGGVGRGEQLRRTAGGFFECRIESCLPSFCLEQQFQNLHIFTPLGLTFVFISGIDLGPSGYSNADAQAHVCRL